MVCLYRSRTALLSLAPRINTGWNIGIMIALMYVDDAMI